MCVRARYIYLERTIDKAIQKHLKYRVHTSDVRTGSRTRMQMHFLRIEDWEWREGLKKEIYDYLLDSIATSKIKPGEAIAEQEISDSLGVSRTPVREVMKQLEAEGIVRHFPSRGTFVETLTIQDVEEIFELRELFEQMALKRAIVLATDEELEAAETAFMNLDDSCIEGDKVKEAYYSADRGLHQLIMGYSGNSRMVRFHRMLKAQMEWLRRISSMTPKRLASSRQEHLDIMYALRQRDLTGASLCLSVHLQNVKESSISVCKNLYWME